MNTLLLFLNILTQSSLICIYHAIILKTKIKNQISRKYALIANLILIVSVIGINLLKIKFVYLVYFIDIIPFFLLLIYFYHMKCKKGILYALLLYFILLLGESFSYISLEVLLKILTVGIPNLLLSSLLSCLLKICYSYFYIYLLKQILQGKWKDIPSSLQEKDIILLAGIILAITFSEFLNFQAGHTNEIYGLVFSTFRLLLIILMSFFFLKSVIRYKVEKKELTLLHAENKMLTLTADGLKIVKHDYDNILSTLNGYLTTKQYTLMEEHIHSLIHETRQITNHEKLNLETLNHPAIFGIVATKYQNACQEQIPFDIEVLTDIQSICFSKIKLSRILGILIDNAIEATRKSTQKYIKLSFRYDERKNASIIQISNTFTNNTLDIQKIFHKGFSTKAVKSGIGLWEVKSIIDATKNVQIFPEQFNNQFIQTIIIEQI